MKRKLLASCMALLMSPLAGHCATADDQPLLSLNLLVQHALEAQPSVAIASYEIERRSQETNMSKAALYPTLDISSEASQKNTSDSGNEQNIENRAALNYRITDFGVRSSTIEKSEHIEDSSRFDFMQTTMLTSSQTAASFMRIEKLKKILAIIEQEKVFYKKMLGDFSELIGSGVAMQSDMRKVQVSIDTLSTQELGYRSQLETEIAKMRNLTGDSVTENNTQRLPDIFEKYKFVTNKQEVMDEIKHDSNTYRSLAKNIDAAKADIEAAKSSNYPTIDASAGYSKNNPSSSANPDDYKDEFKVGIKVGLNIFNGFKNQSEVGKFSARYAQSKLELDEFLIKTQNDIDANQSKYQANVQAMEIAKRSYENADKLTELYKEEFKLGQKSLLDLVSSRSESFQAHITIIETTYGIYEMKLEQMTQLSTLLKQLAIDNKNLRIGSRSLLR